MPRRLRTPDAFYMRPMLRPRSRIPGTLSVPAKSPVATVHHDRAHRERRRSGRRAPGRSPCSPAESAADTRRQPWSSVGLPTTMASSSIAVPSKDPNLGRAGPAREAPPRLRIPNALGKVAKPHRRHAPWTRWTCARSPAATNPGRVRREDPPAMPGICGRFGEHWSCDRLAPRHPMPRLAIRVNLSVWC